MNPGPKVLLLSPRELFLLLTVDVAAAAVELDEAWSMAEASFSCSNAEKAFLGNVLLELVVGPVLQSIVDVLPNISIFISKL